MRMDKQKHLKLMAMVANILANTDVAMGASKKDVVDVEKIVTHQPNDLYVYYLLRR